MLGQQCSPGLRSHVDHFLASTAERSDTLQAIALAHELIVNKAGKKVGKPAFKPGLLYVHSKCDGNIGM